MATGAVFRAGTPGLIAYSRRRAAQWKGRWLFLLLLVLFELLVSFRIAEIIFPCSRKQKEIQETPTPVLIGFYSFSLFSLFFLARGII